MKRVIGPLLREIRERVKEIYGFDIPKEWIFFTKNNKKIFLSTQDVLEFDKQDLNTEVFGLYFCYIDKDMLRLSPEGAQLVGYGAKKNVLNIDMKEALDMIRGFDIEHENNLDAKYVILKSPIGIIGVGKNHKTKILCQIRKNRRVRNLDSI